MNICVYGAASDQIDSSFISAGERLGREIAKNGIGLVFGGGNSGLMGAVARGVHEQNGYILGVAPKFFDKEGVLFPGCTEFRFTETMRQRKQYMEDKSDAFIMTPGGLGTLEEFFEILTLKTLGRHQKPIAVYNTNGYYDNVRDLLSRAAEQKFMEPEHAEAFFVSDDPSQIIAYLKEECR